MKMEGRLLPQYLINAERFIREQQNASVTLSEIANAAGCSENAIVRMFQEYREMHPLDVHATLRDL